MNIHKSQLFWCELQGYKVLTHCYLTMGLMWWGLWFVTIFFSSIFHEGILSVCDLTESDSLYPDFPRRWGLPSLVACCFTNPSAIVISPPSTQQLTKLCAWTKLSEISYYKLHAISHSWWLNHHCPFSYGFPVVFPYTNVVSPRTEKPQRCWLWR